MIGLGIANIAFLACVTYSRRVDYKMVVKEIEDELLEEMDKFGLWFEQDVDGEDEDDIKNKLVMVSEEGWRS
uniref:Uncharacterized protein n=1 Tax=Tanacetum cinerariifolium TaxID=118510 RepID=A0A6L2MP09_TANCI|nr:hypothetical protein [Tanacetum cinerariifolium]